MGNVLPDRRRITVLAGVMAALWVAVTAWPPLAGILAVHPWPDTRWWQVVTAMFTHRQVSHLVANLALMMIAAATGRRRAVGVGLAGGLIGDAAMMLWGSGVALGASGMVCAMLGAALMGAGVRWRPVIVGCLLLLAVNMAAWPAHLAGFLVGVAAVKTPDWLAPSRRPARLIQDGEAERVPHHRHGLEKRQLVGRVEH